MYIRYLIKYPNHNEQKHQLSQANAFYYPIKKKGDDIMEV